jgi:hypothetical protein
VRTGLTNVVLIIHWQCVVTKMVFDARNLTGRESEAYNPV